SVTERHTGYSDAPATQASTRTQRKPRGGRRCFNGPSARTNRPRARITDPASRQIADSCRGVWPMIDEMVPRSAGQGPMIDLRLRPRGEGHPYPNPQRMKGTFTPTDWVKVRFMPCEAAVATAR